MFQINFILSTLNLLNFIVTFFCGNKKLNHENYVIHFGQTGSKKRLKNSKKIKKKIKKRTNNKNDMGQLKIHIVGGRCYYYYWYFALLRTIHIEWVGILVGLADMSLSLVSIGGVCGRT